MTHTLRLRTLAPCLAAVFLLTGPGSVHAQYLVLSPTVVPATLEHPGASTPAATAPRPPLLKPLADVLGDIRRLPTRDNLDWLVVGIGAAIGARTVDTRVTDEFSEARTRSFKPGAIVGGTPLELGAAFATYAIGRATNSPRAIGLGGDLIRAQLLAELAATGLKQGFRRARPEGSGFSFPSGHTTVSFASATVLQQHFGWKAGIPAYAVASYVAASRVQMKRHYLSDVAFGAALGIVAGRTVTIGRRHEWTLTPVVPLGGAGAGAGFTFTGGR